MSVEGGPDIVTDGLVLHLDAANNRSYVSGSTTWFDLSRLGNTGSLINGPTYSPTNQGFIIFDGTNDYVLVNSNAASIPYGSSARTVSIWFYTNTTTWAENTNNLFFYGAGSNGNAFGIDFGLYPVMEFYSWGGSGRDLIWNTAYEQVGWKNITITYNGSTGVLIYENGNLTQTLTLSAACNTTTSNIFVGSINPALQSWYFDGRISQTLLYNRALSAKEVRQNYHATKGRYGLF